VFAGGASYRPDGVHHETDDGSAHGRPRSRPRQVIADKAYSHPSTRQALSARGIAFTSPERRDQVGHGQTAQPIPLDELPARIPSPASTPTMPPRPSCPPVPKAEGGEVTVGLAGVLLAGLRHAASTGLIGLSASRGATAGPTHRS
jgi:hypothetical protein